MSKQFKTLSDAYTSGESYSQEEVDKEATNKPYVPLSEAYKLVNEAPTDLRATVAAKDAIISHPDNRDWGLTKMSDARRIGNKEKLDNDQFLSVLQQVFGLGPDQVQILDPKQGPNKSSKFNMFVYLTPLGKEIQIVLAGGGNAGEDYEKKITEKLQAYIKAEAGDPVTKSEVKTVFDKLDIDPEMVKEISFAGSKDAHRSLDWDDGPANVGKKIADIVIKMETESEDQIIDEHYISVKDKQGDTIYNGGTIPFIKFDRKVIFDEDEYAITNHPSKRFFEVFRIDHGRVVGGLQEYAAHSLDDLKLSEYKEDGKWEDLKLGSDNMRLIKNALASGWGYGYWYLREKGNDIVFEPILNAKEAFDRIGEISEVKIKYPYRKSKSLGLQMLSNGNDGRYKYEIALRNTSGKFLPLAIKMTQYTYKR